MKATLDAPLTINPSTATQAVIHSVLIDFQGRELRVNVELLDASGNTVDRRTITRSGAQAQTYISNQESTFYAQLLAALGVTGTVA